MTINFNYSKARSREDHELDKAMNALDRSILELAKQVGVALQSSPKYPAFNSVESCVKCGMEFYEWDRKEQKTISPRTYYMPSVNLMSCVCPSCGYNWRELCADGSDPIEEKPKEAKQAMMPLNDAVKLIDEICYDLLITGRNIDNSAPALMRTDGSMFTRMFEFQRVVTAPINNIFKRLSREADNLYDKYSLEDENDS